jgi:DNA polymerase (family X)
MVAKAKARAGQLPLGNEDAAKRLEEAARALEEQDANLYRVRAYRTAANTVRGQSRPVSELLKEGGRGALLELPGIGDRLASTLEQLVITGHVQHLEGLGLTAEELLATVPGVGPELARRIHTALGVETLEELERSAHDGRLAQVPGLGEKRLRGIREALAGRFRRAVGGPVPVPPPVADVLAVDAAYREQAAAGSLRTVAPRRFNPTGEAWLPVMTTRRGGYRYRAMYSNTAAAHQAGKSRDWVVVYFGRDGPKDQCTVVTETGGVMAGQRVIRGREAECAKHYGLLPR